MAQQRRHNWPIETVSGRQSLVPRRSPYWLAIGKGRALGFYKVSELWGTWIARWTEPERKPGYARQLYRCKSLGTLDDLSFAKARNAAHAYCTSCAEKWKQNETEMLSLTVAEACVLYIDNMRVEKNAEAAKNSENKLKPYVYANPLGRKRLEDLRTQDVEQWRNGLVTPKRSKRSVNRIYRSFAAAMRYAEKHGYSINPKVWKNVGTFPVRDGHRNGYLTLNQRRALIDSCERVKDARELAADPELIWSTPDLADLLRGLFYSGARPGELVKARVADLNIKFACLALTSAKNNKGESRRREFFLYEPAAFEFFQRMAANKSGDEYLMTRRDGSAWVNSAGVPLYQQWARGLQASVRDVNRCLPPQERLTEKIVAYTARHTVISDLLSESGIEQAAVEKVAGTSARMIAAHYHHIIQERLQAKLKDRHSL